ncbi:MAG: MerR family transcriptional regulator [Microbacteriaceae bacterium]|nr:MerR family transcriptional regulator [Microbacteriaceae bacterium]
MAKIFLDLDAASTFSVNDMKNEWAIQEVARLAGTTSRALRHYDDIALLKPSRVASNGYRYYDQGALVRLQRILLLRQLGLGLPAIAEVVDGQQSPAIALELQLEWLRLERQRLDRQIGSVETTIMKLNGSEQLMAEEILDGFDHTHYRSEVEERWGAGAYAAGDSWWTSKTAAGKAEWMSQQKQLAANWVAAAASGSAPGSTSAQQLAARQADWIAAIPGTPGSADGRPTREYFIGLGELYVADARFADQYGGAASAAFVRDAMSIYAQQSL